jgi:uncharacterized protein YkwD
MKSLVGKFIIVGLLVATALVFFPQIKPLANQVLLPHKVHQAKLVAPPQGVKYLAKVEDLIFDLTNQARLARGLAPLARDDELGNVARAFSNDMLVRRYFDHTTPEGLAFEKRLANQYRHWVYDMGENIWSGSGYDPRETQELAQEIVNDWLNSPGHRENLLDPDFTHLGVGVSARHDRIRATQEFVGRFKL